jgi:2-phosphosulfolactate phosphatase
LEWGEAGVRALGAVVGLIVVVDVLSFSTSVSIAVEHGGSVAPTGSSCAMAAAETGAMVVVGCLRNASAVGRLIAAHGGACAVIAAGDRWPDGSLRPAVEDLLGAGAILAMVDDAVLSPEARAAVGAFRAVRLAIEQPIRDSASGRESIERGFAVDVELAAELDATDRVPVLVDGAFVGGMG